MRGGAGCGHAGCWAWGSGSLQVGWGLAWVSGVAVALLQVAQSEILDDLVVVGVQPGS